MSAEPQAVFRALGDPTRLAIVERLALGEARVTEIAEPLPMSLNGVSKHLKALEQAGVVGRRVDGRVHTMFLRAGAFDAARAWIDRHEAFWKQRLASLKDFMAAEQGGEKDGPESSS